MRNTFLLLVLFALFTSVRIYAQDPSVFYDGTSGGGWVGTAGTALNMGSYSIYSGDNAAHYFGNSQDCIIVWGTSGTDSFRIYCADPTTDVAASTGYLLSGNAYSIATGANQVGGNLYIRGGIGTRQVTIDDYNNCGTDWIRTRIDGTQIDVTEGSEWTAATSNDVTATSLAAALNALAGISATATGAVVYIVADVDTMAVDIQENDATCTTLTEAADGSVLLGAGLASAPSIGWASDPDTGFYHYQAGDGIWVTDDGVAMAEFAGDGIKISSGKALIFQSNLSKVTSSVDGELMITNNAATGFGALTLGPATSSYVRMEVDSGSTTLDLRRGDDVAWANLEGKDLVANGSVFVKGNDKYVGWGPTATSFLIEWDTAQSNNHANFNVVQGGSLRIAYTTQEDRNVNLGLANAADPEFVFASSTVDTDQTELMKLRHDGTHGVIETDKGGFNLQLAQPNIIAGATKALTDEVAVDFVRIGVAQGGHNHGTIWYSVAVVENGDTDLQSLQGTLTFSSVNEGGTVYCDVQKAFGTESYAESDAASTLTIAFACTEDAADTIDISATANTSFAATDTLQLEFSVYTAEDYSVTAL